MDRTPFKLPFRDVGITKYSCPSCAKGNLVVIEKSFAQQETKHSKEMRGHPEWGHEYFEIVYSCIFECSNAACNDVVSSSGIGWDEEEHYYEDDGMIGSEYVTYFSPRVFEPNLKPFAIPKDTPENISKEIEKSFSLIFIDPPSAANHIRVALEHLLTFLRVKRFSTTKGKRRLLFLHHRIELLPKKYENLKEIFLAVKWLGNAGSHSNGDVTLDDVLDSYELTIELLDEVFSKRRKNAKSLAKKINKKRGPK